MKYYYLIALVLTVLYIDPLQYIESDNLSSEGYTLEQKTLETGVFSFKASAGTIGHVDNWGVYHQAVNEQEMTFPGTLIFNKDGKIVHDQSKNKKVFWCYDEEDVVKALSIIPQDAKISVRGGGHDYNGASLLGEYIIFLKDFVTHSGVEKLSVVNGKTIINPTMRNSEIYKATYDIDPTINTVGGSCPTVGISGYVLGGGHGFQSAYYGIATHYLEAVRLVKPNGEVAVINDETDPELMKVIRGGGQNLGVVTEFTFDFSSIPKHTWNAVIFRNDNVNSSQLKHIMKKYEHLVKNNNHEFFSLQFGPKWGWGNFAQMWLLAPSNEVSLQEMIQKVNHHFPQHQSGLQIVQGSQAENLPWFELFMKDIPNFGSIGTEWNYQPLVGGHDHQVSLAWTSMMSRGVKKDIDSVLHDGKMQYLQWGSLDNYKYKKTGPFAANSIYHSFTQSSDDVLFVLQSNGQRDSLQHTTGLFERHHSNYPNYPPTHGEFDSKTFFGNKHHLYDEMKLKLDPTQRFPDKYNSKNYPQKTTWW